MPSEYVSIADLLTDSPPTRLCLVGAWIAEQVPSDGYAIEQAIEQIRGQRAQSSTKPDGYTSTWLFDRLASHDPPFSLGTLRNHVRDRCCCTKAGT